MVKGPTRLRAPANHIKLPWRAEELCPCESGRRYGQCCLQPNGSTRVLLPRLTPPDPLTGYSNPRCYLNSTRDCSAETSREHFISQSVLEITKTFGLRGLPWQKLGEEIPNYGIKALASRILCTRHNSALAPLDTAAARFYRILMQIRDELARPVQYDRGRWFIASGEAIELWTIKTLCGLFFSKIASKDGERLLTDHSLDIGIFDRAIRGMPLPDHCGMWFRSSVGKVEHYVAYAPLSSTVDKMVIGIRAKLFFIEVDTFVRSTDLKFTLQQKQQLFRPWLLQFSNRWRTHNLLLTWPGPMRNVAKLQYNIEADPSEMTPAPPLS